MKNHLFLLKGFKKLCGKYEKVRLLIVGKGFVGEADNTESEIRKFISESKLEQKVMLLGYRSDVYDILSGSDIFCLTSVMEGLPISVIEAMAARLPIIGTNVDGIRDVVNDREHGYLIENGNIEELVFAMQTLVLDAEQRDKFGSESLRIAGQRYSVKAMIKKYEDIFLGQSSPT